MQQVRLTSWQPFPYDQRHPLLGASRSHRVTTDQLRSAREQTPALFGHEFVGYGSLNELRGSKDTTAISRDVLRGRRFLKIARREALVEVRRAA